MKIQLFLRQKIDITSNHLLLTVRCFLFWFSRQGANPIMYLKKKRKHQLLMHLGKSLAQVRSITVGWQGPKSTCSTSSGSDTGLGGRGSGVGTLERVCVEEGVDWPDAMKSVENRAFLLSSLRDTPLVSV